MNDEVNSTSLRDLVECGWEVAVDGVDPRRRDALAYALRKAAASAEEAKAAALKLLAQALEIYLDSERPGGPYFPAVELGGRKSFVPENLTSGEASALRDFAPLCALAPLRARLFDIAWLRRETKHSANAVGAINAFTEHPLEQLGWDHEMLVVWRRAIDLGYELGKEGRPLLDGLFGRLNEALSLADSKRPKFIWDLAALLERDRNRSECASVVAAKLSAVAVQLETEKELSWPATLHEAASRWWRYAKDELKASVSLNAAANVKVSAATDKEQSGEGQALLANSLFEEAIELLRQIPVKHRADLGTTARIDELRARLRGVQLQVLELMEPLAFEIPDALDLIEHTKQAVSGKSLFEALHATIRLHGVTAHSELLARSEQSNKEFLFRKLMSSRHLASDGRTIGKVPASPFGEEASPDRDQALHADIVQALAISQEVFVKTGVLPALEVLQNEHRPRLADLVEICARSPAVLRDRVYTTAQGLFAGFIGDFRTAIYVLVPQLEHMTRKYIQSHGVQTSTLIDEIEEEKGLSSLMKMPEAKLVFGEDLWFEMFVLFCDPLGPNLRNQVAHGLLSDGAASSVETVYAWWFILRLVVGPLRKAGGIAEDAQPSDTV